MKKMKQYKKMAMKISALILVAAFAMTGCGKQTTVDENGNKVTIEDLQAEVDTLKQQVTDMQATIDKYYGGSKDGEQISTFNMDDVTYESIEFPDRLLVVVHNNGTEPVMGLKVLANLYDASNTMIASQEAYVEITVPGSTGVASFDYLQAQDGGNATVDHTDVQLSQENYAFVRQYLNADDFATEVSQTEDKDLMVKVTNNGTENADVLVLTALFYKDGAVVGYNSNTVINLTAGNYDSKKLLGAYSYNEDGTSSKADYDNYEVVISSVYNY